MRHYWGTSPIGSRRTKPPINTPDAGVTGAEGPRGHGQASRSTTPSLQPRVWRSRGRPGPTVPRKPAAPQAPPRRSDGGPSDGRNNSARTATPVTGHCTRYGALHPLWAAAPVMSRCTRSEGVHCLQIGCSAPNHKNKRGICETTADTQKVGERTKRVGFVVTFRRFGAGQSTLKGELFQAAGHRARGAPPALDVGSGAGPVCIVAAESKRVCATSLLTQWCPAWRCARPWASSVGRTGSGRACGVGSGVRRDGCAV